MAESSVTIKLSTSEYRFVRNELEMLATRLTDERKNTKGIKAKEDLRKREALLRFLLERI